MRLVAGQQEKRRSSGGDAKSIRARRLYDVDAGKDGVDRVSKGELLPEVSERFRRSGFLWFGTGYDEEHGSRQNRCPMPLYQAGDVYSHVHEGQTNRVRTTLRCGSSPTRRLGRRDQRVGKFDFRKGAGAILKVKSTPAGSPWKELERENAVGSRTVLDVLDAEQGARASTWFAPSGTKSSPF